MVTSNSQLRVVLVEVLRRGVALALFIAAATAGLGYGRGDLALAGVVLAGLAYLVPPRPRAPEGAVHHERMPTVHMPDFLGFMLATTFFALPLVVSAQERWLEGPWSLYLLTGLPGLMTLVIFWIAIRHQCLWLRVTGHDLTIADLGGIVTLPYAEIAEVEAETKPPPRWLKPLLILFGGWRGLGIALLTAERPSHALIVVRRDGRRLRIPADAFTDMRRVLAALDHGGVRLDAPLHALARKGHQRRKSGHSRTGQAKDGHAPSS
jgi:hypothetical protein